MCTLQALTIMCSAAQATRYDMIHSDLHNVDEGLVDLKVAIARLEGKVDGLIQAQKHAARQEDKDNLVARVSALERSKAYVLGAGIAGGAVFSWIASIVSTALTK